MTQTSSARRGALVRSCVVAPGVRLHCLRPRPPFTTTLCRVAFHTLMGPQATAMAVLGQVMQSSTERDPTRIALAQHLADLYGGSLRVGVEKLGDRQVLAAALEWPTAHVSRSRSLLAQGLSLLQDVLVRPLRRQPGAIALDPETVATERQNHQRALQGLRNDKARYAARRCVAALCAGEPFGLETQGREEDLEAVTPEALGDLHRSLLARAPAEIFLVGDIDPAKARKSVEKHLLWSGRTKRTARVPPAGSVRPPRARPRRIQEDDAVTQGKLVLGYRAAVRPTSPLAPAAEVLAGVLGGGPYARLFKVVREEHGLCYYASAAWVRAKGLMLVQSGIEREHEPRARRLIGALAREVAGGTLEPTALEGYRQSIAFQCDALLENRGAMMAWTQNALALGLDPAIEVWRDRLLAVRPADVRRVGRKLRLDTTFFLRPQGRRGRAR